MRPLRFCHFTTFYPPYNFGGDGIGIQRFSRALRDRGHHVTILHDADAYLALGGKEPENPSTDDGGIEIPLLAERENFMLASLLGDHQHPLLRFA